MNTRVTPAMDRAAFFEWAGNQPRGRFERVDGEVIAMSPERWAHARLKAAIWRALDDQAVLISQCTVAPNGMTIAVDAGTDFEPDVSVHVGDPIFPASMTVPNPVIVIEVVSPSSRRIDTVIKRDGYFRVASIVHYLVFRSDRREMLHWRRDDGAPSQYRGRCLLLAPPGLTVDLDAIYARAEAA